MPRIESVTIGAARRIANSVGITGIWKEPVDEAVLTPLGLTGDVLADTKYHGGLDQAAYLYRSEDYDWWSEALGRELAAGTFGENFTVSGLPDNLAIGDRIAAGAVVLEVTAPRIPCGTLAKRMGDRQFVKAFRDAERPGAYCRVVVPGVLRPGVEVAHHPFAGDRVSLVDLYRDLFRIPALDAARVERLLALPVAARVRIDLEKRRRAIAKAR